MGQDLSRSDPSRLAYSHHSLQLFQQRQPAIERPPSWSKRRVKEDCVGPDFGTAPDILADLFERAREYRPVLAQRFVGDFQDGMNHHHQGGWVPPGFVLSSVLCCRTCRP